MGADHAGRRLLARGCAGGRAGASRGCLRLCGQQPGALVGWAPAAAAACPPGPGQFTDDTELALCLAAGLVGHPPSAGFPASRVARQYAWWVLLGAAQSAVVCQSTRRCAGEAPRLQRSAAVLSRPHPPDCLQVVQPQLAL